MPYANKNDAAILERDRAAWSHSMRAWRMRKRNISMRQWEDHVEDIKSKALRGLRINEERQAGQKRKGESLIISELKQSPTPKCNLNAWAAMILMVNSFRYRLSRARWP
jgi:hypothetical protein